MWSDTDALFVKDPLQYLGSIPNHDIYVSPGGPNTGFLYLRYNAAVTQFVQAWLALRSSSHAYFPVDDQIGFHMLLAASRLLHATVLELPQTHFVLGCHGCGLDVLEEVHGSVSFRQEALCVSEMNNWIYVHLTCAGYASNHRGVLLRKFIAQTGVLQAFAGHGSCQALPD